jgi:hypothetical protein
MCDSPKLGTSPIGWWDDEPARTKKITPLNRDWSWKERIAMR